MFGIFRILLWLAEVVIGIGLLFGCARGLLTQEWVYDRQSAQMMNVSQWIGLGIGLLLLAHAFGFISIPLPFLGGCPPSG